VRLAGEQNTILGVRPVAFSRFAAILASAQPALDNGRSKSRIPALAGSALAWRIRIMVGMAQNPDVAANTFGDFRHKI
jgi:hypothetical protein